MTDRSKRNRDKEEAPRGGAPRRSGLGDDQGTRVGTPDSGDEAKKKRRSTGAGAEAARGAHAFGSGRKGDAAQREEHSPRDENLPGTDQPGSEPLRGTERQHESGYGGRGDKPKPSSNQREPLDYEGSGGDPDRR